MPRKLQGAAHKGNGKGAKSIFEREAPALATQCMGEEGRDYLRRFLQETPFAGRITKCLDEDGYCHLPGIFSLEEADRELERAWGFVQKVSPTIRKDDWNTWWRNGNAPDPWPYSQRDMMQLHQAGWVFSELRETLAERVFEPLYGMRELHVSKDGFTFQRPTDGDLNRTVNDHFDQGGRWLGLQCIQGSVALTDQSPNDGCFQVWPGSHRHREEILSAPRHLSEKGKRSDFIILSQDERELLQSKGIQPLRVPAKRGDVILWRSDVCHCGAPPLGRCDTSRVVAYVCCLPASLTPESVYVQKQRAYERLETGTHYPNREEWFEMIDRHKRLPWKPYFTSLPELSVRQRELYGLQRYAATAATERPPEVLQKSEIGPISGLQTACVNERLVRSALVELRPHFRPSKGKSNSSMFEVGWSFHALEKDGVMRVARPLAEFPCLRAMLTEAMQLLSGKAELYETSLNIICRRYTRGQGLPLHVDRPGLFDEDVYGCVLINTSSTRLTFQSKSEERIEFDESQGSCFVQRGEARYEWSHGVEPISDGGERISVTWRWIAEKAMPEGQGSVVKGKGKSSGTGKGYPTSPAVDRNGIVNREPGGNSTAGTRELGEREDSEGGGPSTAKPAKEKERRWGRRAS